jgi:hypothetical protein
VQEKTTLAAREVEVREIIAWMIYGAALTVVIGGPA